MTETPMTLDRLRADVAAMLNVDASDIDDEENLQDAGLDSMRAMNLVLQWEEAGVPLDFPDLLAGPTVAELWAVLRERQEESRP